MITYSFKIPPYVSVSTVRPIREVDNQSCLQSQPGHAHKQANRVSNYQEIKMTLMCCPDTSSFHKLVEMLCYLLFEVSVLHKREMKDTGSLQLGLGLKYNF